MNCMAAATTSAAASRKPTLWRPSKVNRQTSSTSDFASESLGNPRNRIVRAMADKSRAVRMVQTSFVIRPGSMNLHAARVAFRPAWKGTSRARVHQGCIIAFSISR
ncbi:MAG: hypothetical protein ABSA77_03255 [Thermoguttaceae bacterium]